VKYWYRKSIQFSWCSASCLLWGCN